MKLGELLSVVAYDSVCLYYRNEEAEAPSFEDIYEGSCMKIPPEYLDAEVKILGAKEKDVLDIQLNTDDICRKEKSS